MIEFQIYKHWYEQILSLFIFEIENKQDDEIFEEYSLITCFAFIFCFSTKL